MFLGDGAIHRIKVTNGGSGYSAFPTVTIYGNGTSAAATAVVNSGVITDILLETGTSTITYNHGSGYGYATVVITDTTGANATGKALIGPPGGFGKYAIRDLRSHYAVINKPFIGDESGVIPSSGSFRQISIIENPYSGSSTIASADSYNPCKSLSVVGSFTPAETITGTSSGAVGVVVEYDSTSGSEKLYYVQDRDSGYLDFTTSDNVGSGAHSVTAVNSAGLVYDSGRIMFAENRDAVSRSSSQTETIRLVIEF